MTATQLAEALDAMLDALDEREAYRIYLGGAQLAAFHDLVTAGDPRATGGNNPQTYRDTTVVMYNFEASAIVISTRAK